MFQRMPPGLHPLHHALKASRKVGRPSVEALEMCLGL